MFLKLHLQVMFDDLIDLAVCLGMINRIEAFLDAELVAEFSKLFAIKLCAII